MQSSRAEIRESGAAKIRGLDKGSVRQNVVHQRCSRRGLDGESPSLNSQVYTKTSNKHVLNEGLSKRD